MGKKTFLLLVMLLCIASSTALLFAEGSSELTAISAKPTAKTAVYGFAAGTATVDANKRVTANLYIAGKSSAQTFTSLPLTDQEVLILTQAPKFGVVNYPIIAGAFVEVLYNAKHEVSSFNVVEKAGTFFDTAKYGGELSPVAGKPGNMVANGWILGKTDEYGKMTLTIGDGNETTNIFKQTYTLADDAKVYLVDNAKDYAISNGSFADINVTKAVDGVIYDTAQRYQAICVFDSNYEHYGIDAKVAEVYLFSTATEIDPKFMLEPDDMPVLSPYDSTNADDKLPHLPQEAPWLTSTLPFTIIQDRLYYIGDHEVASYLLQTADGKLAMVDTGWPNSGYQYMMSIEKLGFDPRDIDYILMSHGHGDHYGTAWELDRLIKNAGGDPIVYECKEDTVGLAEYGYPELKGIISDAVTLAAVDEFYQYDEWFTLGEGIQLYSYLTQGHSQGSPSMIIKIETSENDPVFKPGTVVSFEYMGGYGAMPRLSQGYTRLAFAYSLRYIQQIAIPLMESVSDYIYPLPQHTNHYPLLEAYKAATIAGVPVISVLSEGAEGIINQLEKRQATQTSETYFQAWKNGTDATGGTCELSSPTYKTNEAFGPFKRPSGKYTIEVADNGLVMHGYDAWLNPSDAFVGQYNRKGEDMSLGFNINKDSHVHDPNGWFVQISVHVDDDYDGTVNYDTNFYKGYAEKWTSGPIESVHKDWVEIMRTGRLDSKEEAEALLAKIKNGGKYEVNLNMNSDIILDAKNVMNTFAPVK